MVLYLFMNPLNCSSSKIARTLDTLEKALCSIPFGSFLGRAIRHYTAKRGSAFVRCADMAVKELRANQPHLFPSTSHTWTSSTVEPASPVVCCAVCMEPVEGRKWQSCESCSVVVHKRCSRYAQQDCRPIAVQADRPLHDWKPAGVLLPFLLHDSDQGPSSWAPNQSLHSCPFDVCLCCREACEVGMFAVEPVFCCTCCHTLVHMRCYIQHNPTLFSAATKAALRAQLLGLDEALEYAGSGTFSLEGPSSPRAHSPGSSYFSNHPPPPCLMPGQQKQLQGQTEHMSGVKQSVSKRKGRADSLDGLRKSSSRPPSRSPNSSGNASRSSEGGHPQTITARAKYIADTGVDSTAFPQQLNEVSLALNDLHYDYEVCHLGTCAKLSLPNTAVQHVSSERPDIAASRSISSSGIAPSVKGAVSGPAARVSSVVSRSKSLTPSIRGSGSKTKTLAALSTSKRLIASGKKWWRQLRDPKDRWSSFKLDAESLRCSPLIVFINIKSGPQLGITLKRQLMQLLHPLQVVELPRESPEPALRFFFSAPGARILVIGGDGTVSWILSCLDGLAKEQGDIADTRGTEFSWSAPPVAVLPLGTGNDLARCLNWGGSLSILQQQSMPLLLNEVAMAAPVTLDRWNVCIKPATSKQHQGGSLKRLLKRSSNPAQVSERLQQHQVKVMNNYVGIGIDAKVALEFHEIRDNYPGLFKSQFGNKMMYTGVGTFDLVRRSCVGLHQRLSLICDGVTVPLPHDAEGLVILNIGCHMGGVYLWEDGLPASPPPGLMPECRALMNDKVLEVVAIGGVLHMGRLAVGLSRGQRLCQAKTITILTHDRLPMQIDGEPWMQSPGELSISVRGQGLLLKRLPANNPATKMASLFQDVLASSVEQGIINDSQRRALAAQVLARLEQ